MEDYITRAEHTEFCARMDAENNRQNRRIELLEGTTKQIQNWQHQCRNWQCLLKAW